MMQVQGQEIEGAGEGFLCMKAAWPSTIRTIFGDQERFETTYFAPFKVGASTAPLPCGSGLKQGLERYSAWGWGRLGGGRGQGGLWRL